MQHRKASSKVWRILHAAMVFVGSIVLTLVVFLVLPAIQAIAKDRDADTLLQPVETASLPPPPSAIEDEPEPEPEKEEPPPELEQELPPLDLGQLDLALTPGSAEGWGAALSFHLDLGAMAAKNGDSLFSLSDLDQKPRVVFQANPILDSKLRRRTPANVNVVFVVDEQGRVQEPKVWKSSDSAFDNAALAAVKQWKFEPGKRNGKSVRFRMRVTVSFPDSR